MTRIVWGALGERTFEAGVDRGVLYVDGVGVPWNGLASVNEAPTGGEARAYYIDGVKYQNRTSPEEFAATIEAYTYPREFAECDGSSQIANGLYATQRRRKPFGLAYRTFIGNDLQGIDHAYKIHLVYGALVAPSARSARTMSGNVDPDNFSWSVTTRPPRMEGRKPTSHFFIDSRAVPPAVLKQIEDILYGTETEVPRLPAVHELYYIFTSYNASIFDAGPVDEPFYVTFDGGTLVEAQTSVIDGGVP